MTDLPNRMNSVLELYLLLIFGHQVFYAFAGISIIVWMLLYVDYCCVWSLICWVMPPAS